MHCLFASSDSSPSMHGRRTRGRILARNHWEVDQRGQEAVVCRDRKSWRAFVNAVTPCNAGDVKTLAFANFSAALMAAAPKKALVAAGAGSPSQTSASPSALGYRSVVLDYGKQVRS